MGYLSNGGRERNELWHKGSLGDEDDVRTSDTRIAQRKRAIPHSTMKNNRNNVVITFTRGRHVPANKRALALRTSVTTVTLLVLICCFLKITTVFMIYFIGNYVIIILVLVPVLVNLHSFTPGDKL